MRIRRCLVMSSPSGSGVSPVAALQGGGAEDDHALGELLELGGHVEQVEQVEHEAEGDDAEERAHDRRPAPRQARAADDHGDEQGQAEDRCDEAAGGQAAALLVAFALLAAAALRRDVEASRRRLTWFGARRSQLELGTAAEVGVVALAGTAVGRALGVSCGLKSIARVVGLRAQQVAELAADGAKSREIAGQLFLSPRTVENHLQRVYTKLGGNGREALAPALRPLPQR